MDTIFALATVPGKAGVAVIRVSGPHSWASAKVLAGSLPKPRQSALRRLRDQSGYPLDDALVLCFAKGHSFTGEDTVEFQLHGSTAVVSVVLAELAKQPELRLAEPGEFTRQALENGCLDLSQVEGLADLIESETEAQRRQAMRVFDGALGGKVDIWRRDLIRAVSLIEATIDFADEDIPTDVSPEVLTLLGRVKSLLQAERDGVLVSERIRNGFEVAIIGPPNIGKSTLLNRLAGREAAITSEIAGTTRDVIEVRMDLSGLPVMLLDTAGLRETDDVIEGLGVERALSRAKSADLRVFLVAEHPDENLGMSPLPDDLIFYGKQDLRLNNNELGVSGETGEGVSELVDAIAQNLENKATGTATATRLRHRMAIEQAVSYLDSAIDYVNAGQDQSELAAEELHQAIRALDSLIGKMDVEHVLDEIFSSFCLGK